VEAWRDLRKVPLLLLVDGHKEVSLGTFLGEVAPSVVSIPALLAEMRNDLAHFPLRRECVLLSRHWSYWAKGNQFSYFFEDHEDLLSQFQILANNGLVVNIKYNSVERFQITEKLAEYLGA
jgi:hypothetical protein